MIEFCQRSFSEEWNLTPFPVMHWLTKQLPLWIPISNTSCYIWSNFQTNLVFRIPIAIYRCGQEAFRYPQRYPITNWSMTVWLGLGQLEILTLWFSPEKVPFGCKIKTIWLDSAWWGCFSSFTKVLICTAASSTRAHKYTHTHTLNHRYPHGKLS